MAGDIDTLERLASGNADEPGLQSEGRGRWSGTLIRVAVVHSTRGPVEEHAQRPACVVGAMND
jgi:hypothetical protein